MPSVTSVADTIAKLYAPTGPSEHQKKLLENLMKTCPKNLTARPAIDALQARVRKFVYCSNDQKMPGHVIA